MTLNRRSLAFAALATSAALTPGLLAARQATPATASEGEPLPPEVLFETLREGTIASPLFPSDTPALSIEVWDDAGDRDLDGAIGGLLVQAGPGDDGLIGVYIVHPTIEQAAARLVPDENDGDPLDLFGFPVVWHQLPADVVVEDTEAFALIATQVGSVLISAMGQGAAPSTNALRALANLSGMVDHLLQITRPADQ